MPTIDAAFLRNRYPKLKDASDTEIARIAHQAFAPDTDYKQFETQFLGAPSFTEELGKGIVRGARAAKGGLDFLAGGVASVFGDTAGADQNFKSFDANMAANRRNAARVGITDVRSAKDAAMAVAGIGGEALPMLAAAPLGMGAVGAVGGLSSAAQAPGRVNDLMDPGTSNARKAAAAGAMTFVGGAADAFIPARILAGTAKAGLGGVARDIGLNAALGAATPLAERGIAGALNGGSFEDAAGRGGAAQIGEEVLGGAAAGAVTAGIARPVMGVAERAARPIQRAGQAAGDMFSRFARTPTGDVDLTASAPRAYADLDSPAVGRNPGPWYDGVTGLAGSSPDAIPPRFTDIAGQGSPADPLAVMRGELPAEPTGVAPGIRRSVPAEDPMAAMADAQRPAPDSTGLDMADPRLQGAQFDLFDGPVSPLPPQADAPAASGIARSRRQGELDFSAPSAPIYVDRTGRQVSPAVATADPALVQRAQAQTDAARMAQAQPGQTVDMFGAKPSVGGRQPETPDPAAPVDPRPAPRQGVVDPSLLTTADLLTALQDASKATGIKAFQKDQPVGGKSKYGLKSILEAKDPVAAIREAYQDGGHDKAELLDVWHQYLTGQKLSAPAPEAAPVAPEPAPAPAAPKVEAPAAARPATKPADTRTLDQVQLEIDRASARDAEIAKLSERYNDAADEQTALSNQLEALREKYDATGDGPARDAIAQDIEKTKAAYDQATEEATSSFDALMAAKDAPDDALSAKFSPSEDLPARASRGIIEMEAMLSRAGRQLQRARNKPERERAEQFQWQVREELNDLRKALRQKGGPPASAVASLEKAVANLRAWEDRTWGKADAPGFGPAPDQLNSKIGRREFIVGTAAALADNSQAATTLGRAKPISREILKGKVSAKVEALLRDGNRSGTTSIDGSRALIAAMREIAVNGPPEVRALAGKVAQLLPTQGLMLTVNDTRRVNAHGVVELSPMPHMTLFTAEGREGLTLGTVVHEALHAAVAARYRTLSQGIVRSNDAVLGRSAPAAADALAQFRSVWTEFSDLVAGEGGAKLRTLDERTRLAVEESAGNPDEFFVRALTDPSFQSYLASREYKGKTLFQRFKDWVKTSLFGLKSEGTAASWLDAALAAADDTAEAMGKDAADWGVMRDSNRVNSRANSQKSVVALNDVMADRMARRAEQGDTEAIGYTAGAGIARDVAQRIRDIPDNAPLEFFRKKLSLLTTNQLVEQYGKMVRGASDLMDAMQRKFSAEYGATARADNVLKGMMDLPRLDRDRLTDVAFAATEAELHPDKPLDKQRPDPTPAEIEMHRLLAAKYEALSPQAKKTYQDIRKVMDDQFVEVVTALRRLVSRVEPDPQARRDRLLQIDQMIGKTRGPYFPMSRFGDYVTIAKNAASDGRSIVQHFDTPAEQQRGRLEMIRNGIKPDAIVMTMRSENRLQQEVSTPFVESIRSAIDNTIEDPTQRAAMTQALNELVIRALPAASGAKNFIRRRNVEGYSTDAARAIADSVVRAGRYVSNLNFTPDMNAAVAALKPFHRANAEQMPVHAVLYERNGVPQVEVYASPADRLRAVDRLMAEKIDTQTVRATLGGMPEKLAAAGLPDDMIGSVMAAATKARDANLVGGDVRKAQAVADHLAEKAAALTAPKNESEVFRALGQLAHIKYLGLSPAYWLTNLAQIPTMTLPHLGGKYGVGRTSAALGKALPAASTAFKLMMQHLGTGRGAAIELSNLKGVTPEEREALQYMADRGQLDITQTNDLAHVARGEGSARRTAMEYITAGAHYTEIFNRMVTGLAAYRLARDSGVQHQAAMRQSLDDVEATQFNYAEYNKPMLMQRGGPFGAPARLVFMFQQYAQNTLYWWGRNIQKAAGDDPAQQAEARKAMGLAAVGLSTMAGVAGLPLVGTIHMLVNMLFSGDDPGWDAERELEAAVQEMGASKTTARVMTRGLFAVAGSDLSSRLGQGDLLSKIGLTQQQAERREMSRNPEQQFFMDLLGPVGSMAGDIPKAIDAAREGDMAKLFGLVPVKGLADIARAVDYGTNGVRNKAGDVLLAANELSEVDIGLKAIGFQPSDVQEMYRARNAANLVTQRAQENRDRIARAIARGLLAGDEEAMVDGLEKLQKYNAGVAEKFPQLVLTGPALSEAVRRIVTAQAMLQLTGGTAKNPRALLLALQLNPGLQVGASPSEDVEDAGN